MPKNKSIKKKNKKTKEPASPAQPKDETALIKKRLDEKSFSPVILVAQSEESMKIMGKRRKMSEIQKSSSNGIARVSSSIGVGNHEQIKSDDPGFPRKSAT